MSYETRWFSAAKTIDRLECQSRLQLISHCVLLVCFWHLHRAKRQHRIAEYFLSHARSTRRKASQAFPLLALCVANHVVDIVSILRRKPLRILNVPSSSSSTSSSSSSLLRIAFEPASDSGWLSFSLTLFFTALWQQNPKERERKSRKMWTFSTVFRFLRACFSLFYSDYD